jgi:glycosyltransferase involved in cell wall biosynthesis
VSSPCLPDHELARGRRIAVSLTPVSLDGDSRAFRIAGSLADAGFRSVVVEGRASSDRFWGEAVEVRSIDGPSPISAAPSPPTAPHRRVLGALRDGRLGSLGEQALYLGFRSYDWWRHCHRPERLLPEAELYYVHSFELYRAVAPIAARLGAAVIYDAHDFYRGIEPIERQRSFDRNHLRPFLDGLEDRAIAAADAIVTVSEGVAGLMERAFGRRATVIRNCHDERRDRPLVSPLRRVLGLSAEDRLCVVVGNCKPGMAVSAAADALALLPECFHLAFVGRGYEAMAAKLQDHTAASRLHFGHFAAPDAIVPALRSADIGLVIYEAYSENYRCALPNGFFQIVAAGLPIVRGYLPEIEAAIDDHPVGACLAHLDPPSLAQAILRCADDAGTLRVNAAALAREFRWETEATRLRNLIDSVVVRSTPTSIHAVRRERSRHRG